jgi:peptidoglycan hydrolase-like protein with peptidoglycan-binding domain
VKKWQYFLAGQGFTKIVADGVFGDKTHEATIEFQQLRGLKPDGIVGTYTLSKAGMLGLELVKNPSDNDPTGIHKPEKPAFPCLTQRELTHFFGKFGWKIKPGDNPAK